MTAPFQLITRALPWLAVLAGFVSSAFAEGSNPTAVFPERHFEILEKYCLDCHDSLTEKGKVNLEDLSFTISDDLVTADLWLKVLKTMNSGEMPPEDKDQLSAQEKTEFLEDLSNQLVTAQSILSDSGGVITMRRLNRREYRNTMFELLGIEPDVATLPDDSGIGGFDTNGASLFFSSYQFEQYFLIAEKALSETLLISNEKPERTVERVDRAEWYRKEFQESEARAKEKYDRAIASFNAVDRPLEEFGFKSPKDRSNAKERYPRGATYRMDYLSRPETKEGVTLIYQNNNMTHVRAPGLEGRPFGRYIMRFRAGAYEDSPVSKRFIEYGRETERTKSGEIELLGYHRVDGTINDPGIIEVPVDYAEGSQPNIVIRQKTANFGQNKIADTAYFETGAGIPPVVWLDWIEMDGPIVDEWPPASYQEILLPKDQDESDEDYARRVITTFATRAFRGKAPTPEYVASLMIQYSDGKRSGFPRRKALIAPLATILASPDFLYLSEPVDEQKQNRQLSDRELAIRLAFFLWSGPPDQELLDLAENGELLDPATLKTQTQRMLEDERSEQFIQAFTHQWLEMGRLSTFTFDAFLYPEFDETIRNSAGQEIYETIRLMLDEELPIGSLLKSDFIVVNEPLANHYNVSGVEGQEFQKVVLPEGSPRGGLLGMAAVHIMGSDGVRTSPVERGAWVLRHLLDDPPPPAPPNVPQLSRLEGEIMPAREMLKAHMEEAQCAQCHRKIDPIGFGLDNFDPTGQWRTEEEVTNGIHAFKRFKSTKFPIETAGTLPDRTAFEDYFQLRDLIADKEEAFAYGFAKGLISYGLGRPYSFSDANLADQMMEEAGKNGMTISAFVQALVQSDKFRNR